MRVTTNVLAGPNPCIEHGARIARNSHPEWTKRRGPNTDDIARHGFRQAPNGRSYEGKLFATSPEDAATYGRINYGQDSVPFHIVETSVSRSFADQLFTGTADRMTFRAVDPDQLADLNRLGRTTIWNHLPWVAKP